MTLYFDNRVKFTEPGIITTVLGWHQNFSLLAVASYSQDRGGFITIFDENGTPIENNNENDARSGQQATTLAWHPIQQVLAVGWEDGALFLWKIGSGWQVLQAPHSAPPLILSWSNGGGRLVVADAAGAITGWQYSGNGLLTTYHLTLEEILTHITFCPIRHNSDDSLVRGLAKAAIAGDEGALDALSTWRPRTTLRTAGTVTDNHSFYAAQQNGSLLYVDESGTCSEVLPSTGNVRFMTSTSSGYLIVAWEISGTLSLTRFAIGMTKTILEAKTHVKMSTKAGLDVSTAGGSSVAILAGDTTIRIWESETNDNYLLPVEDSSPTHSSEMFTSIGYCKLSGALSCGSNQGRVFVWRRNPQNNWQLLNICTVKGNVKQVCWGSESGLRPLLAVNSITSVSILREQPICWGFTQHVWGVQKGPYLIQLEGPKSSIANVKTEVCVKAMCLSDNYLAVTDGKEVQVLKIAKDIFNFLPIHKFSWQTETLLLHEETLVGIVGMRIESKTISGIPLTPLLSNNGEGEPIGISRTDKYLAIATMDGYIKIAEINKKGLKCSYGPKNCYQLFDDFGEIMYADVNSTGKLVCMAIATANLFPESRLYLWDASLDSLTYFQLYGLEKEPGIPITICWDMFDPRFLSCHVRSQSEDTIRCYFVHNGNILEHKNWGNLNDNQSGYNLCTISAPQIITMQDGKIIKNILREFVNFEDYDTTTKSNLMDYLYYMTNGQMSQAVLAIGNTGASNTVWKELAKACVLQKRLDVAAVCLAKMNDVKGALALHMVLENPKECIESRTAILAIHLGMHDEAIKLFESCGRFDQISRLIAATKDGLEKLTMQSPNGESALLIKNAHYKLACMRRDSENFESAAQSFEKAGVEVPHMPRMYHKTGQLSILKMKVSTSKNPELHKWWAHYLESQGELESALESYETAGDIGARARLLCNTDRLNDAKLILDSPVAAYYVGRHLELQPENIEDAIKMYIKAGAPAAAVRCAAEAGLWDQVTKAGNCSNGAGNTNAHILLAATALEKVGKFADAAKLYHKSGKMHNAVEAALKGGNAGAEILTSIADSLINTNSSTCDPELAYRLVAPLLTSSQFPQAATILASAKLFDKSLDLIEENNVEISEDLAEKLTPPKGTQDREEILKRLSDMLGNQGHYHLAAKKLTQAGDKVGAMRWLVKSGDVDKIVFFASAARERAVYLMAARALQANDWRSRPALLRRVATMYEKARAPRPLAAFYASCARQEIEEYENYEKAAAALGEALRCLSKSGDPQAATDSAMIQQEADRVQQYILIEKAFKKGDYQNGISSAELLLSEIDGKTNDHATLVQPQHLLNLMATYSTNASKVEKAKEYSEKARMYEKQHKIFDNDISNRNSPTSELENTEYIPEELPVI